MTDPRWTRNGKDYTSAVLRMAGNIAAGLAAELDGDEQNTAQFAVDIAQTILDIVVPRNENVLFPPDDGA